MPENERPSPFGTGGEESPDETEIKPVSPGVELGRANVRFTPGTVLADRYRVVSLLGRGGMGEVYRAEDVKLGQAVALKFLPREVAADRTKLARLYDEVRIGRQVSHPNVCRIYDIDAWEGHHFISMEYIDGEDLASLLRRIGKLPQEKALEIARDLASGLAAAHGLGIIHRDIKPANVMIDGRGNARLTDFGLAALAENLGPRTGIAGTPAYMAPEQADGGEITVRTDLYALGLILYEIFTGKRLFEGRTWGEIASQRKASSSQSLSRETGDLDPAVQRVIVRCLEDDPAKRPSSIHSVIASLPGGDPLQAAIDAGETPSPEMVAAAGSIGELEPKVAWPLLLVTILTLCGGAGLWSWSWPSTGIDLPREPQDLAFHAGDILQIAGVTEAPIDTIWAFDIDADYCSWLWARGGTTEVARKVAASGFGPAVFGYRASPGPILAAMPGLPPVYSLTPALDVPDAGAQITFEPSGRLRRVVVVRSDEIPANAAAPDWSPFFGAAGLDAVDAIETTPLWRPPVGADRRFAWSIAVAGLEEPLRIEAASLAGRPVWFELMPPWKGIAREGLAQGGGTRRLETTMLVTVFLLLLVFGGFLAHRNFRRGRGDRQGAWRVASFIALTTLVSRALPGHVYRDALTEVFAIMAMLKEALFWGAIVWVWYLALEPYLRRRWPRTLISWSRLLRGRWLDPLVGRDILVGVFGAGCLLVIQTGWIAASTRSGRVPPIPRDLLGLSSVRETMGHMVRVFFDAVVISFLLFMVLLLVHLLVRRRAIAIAIVFAVASITLRSAASDPSFDWATRIVFSTVVTWVMVRYGLVSLCAFLVTSMSFVYTLDPGEWYFGRSLTALVFLVGLAVFGFVRSLGSRAFFAEPLLDE